VMGRFMQYCAGQWIGAYLSSVLKRLHEETDVDSVVGIMLGSSNNVGQVQGLIYFNDKENL